MGGGGVYGMVLLHIQCPIYKLEKGGQGAHDIFRRGGGGGASALDDRAFDPLLFQKGGIFPIINKTLKGHSYHLIFHIKRSSGVHADRNIKDSYWRLCYY